MDQRPATCPCRLALCLPGVAVAVCLCRLAMAAWAGRWLYPVAPVVTKERMVALWRWSLAQVPHWVALAVLCPSRQAMAALVARCMRRLDLALHWVVA